DFSAGADGVFGNLASRKCRRDQPRISTDRQGIGIPFDAAGQCHESPGTLTARKRPCAPAWRQTASIRVDPYLEKLAGFVLLVELAMGDAGAGTHHLHVTRCRAAAIAQAVFVADGALAYVGDDFHVAVGMGREARVSRDAVVVPDAQLALVHARRVMVVGQGEMVMGIEPAVIGTAQLGPRT